MDSLVEKGLNRNIVFFDVCGTLYESNTTFDFVEFCFRDNRVFKIKRFFLRSYLGRFLIKLYNKLFKKDFLRFYYIGLLRQFNQEELTTYVDLFFERVLTNKKINVVWNMLSEYKKQDYTIVLISASLDILIGEVARRVSADSFYATQLVFIKGRCNGTIQNDLFGNKNEILNLLSIDHYEKSIFVTDNFNDINVSELVKDFIVISNRKDMKWWKLALNNPVIYEK